MGFCPYFYNLYNAMYEEDNGMNRSFYGDDYEEMTRGFYDDDEYDNISEDEEQEYFDDMMRQASAQEINRIMALVDTQHGYLYNELQRNGINRNTARYMFRTMVSFTANNASKYSGNPEQKTTAILNDFRKQYAWIFFVLRANGINRNRADQIARTIIAFTLANLHTQPSPPEDLEQRATRITNLIRQQTDIFTRLQNFGVSANLANSFVRTTVLYVLRSSNPAQTPANIEARAGELLRMFEAANPTLINQMQNAGVPMGQIRVLLRAIILFTLRNIYSREME